MKDVPTMSVEKVINSDEDIIVITPKKVKDEQNEYLLYRKLKEKYEGKKVFCKKEPKLFHVLDDVCGLPLKIINLTNKEIINENSELWSTKYNQYIGEVCFDEFLTGCWCDGDWYINYVRAMSGSGIYHLSEIEVLKKDISDLIDND